MNPYNILRLQFMETFANPRHTGVRIGISILLAFPFILIHMPARAKASGMLMVILFTTFFGSAIAHARLCEDGRFSRLRMLPIPRPILWLDLIISATIARLVPAIILLTGFLIFNAPTFDAALLMTITAELCASVTMLVALATLIGHITRSNGLVHLISALTCAIIAFVSGLIPTVPKLASLTHAMAANPLYRLQYILAGWATGTLTVSGGIVMIYSVMIILFALAVILRFTIIPKSWTINN